MPDSWLAKWKRCAQALRRETCALYWACRDARTPWYAKALAACVVAYALSPIDLIPDPIPLLGYLDDLVLIPLGIALVRRLIPRDVLEECRRRAEEQVAASRLARWTVTAVIVVIWLVVIGVLARVVWRWYRS